MKNFALIGAAGYIAPRHMKAIKDTGNQLLAALDPSDTVGILDSYFPEARFFTEFERFDRHIEMLRREGTKLDYVAVTSPNYLHDSHIRFALRVGADAICEKPLVVNPWNAEGLRKVEDETGGRIFTILQLRLHERIVALRAQVEAALAVDPAKVFEIDLTYIASRGAWYFASWKGEDKKSGGIVANIGVHFYDMLLWVFGPMKESRVTLLGEDVASGTIELAHARVRWFLSVNAKYLPEVAIGKGQRTYRSIEMDGEEIEFSEGFTELHTESYRTILSGDGFGLNDAIPAIELVYAIRKGEVSGLKGEYHPYAAKVAQ